MWTSKYAQDITAKVDPQRPRFHSPVHTLLAIQPHESLGRGSHLVPGALQPPQALCAGEEALHLRGKGLHGLKQVLTRVEHIRPV